MAAIKTEKLMEVIHQSFWEESKYHVEGVRCYKNKAWEESSGIMAKTEWTVKVPFKKIHSMFRDPQTFYIMFKHESIVDVKDVTVKENGREFRIDWWFPFPYNTRECYCVQYEHITEESAFLIWDDPGALRKIDLPHEKGFVLAILGISGLVMTRDPDDSKQTLMKFLFQFNPAGSIPKWLAKNLWRSFVENSTRITEYAEFK